MLQYDHCSVHNFALSNIIDHDDVLANSISIFGPIYHFNTIQLA